jgi:hypothetical protein
MTETTAQAPEPLTHTVDGAELPVVTRGAAAASRSPPPARSFGTAGA